MHSFPPMTKTPRLRCVPRYRRRYAGRFFCRSAGNFPQVQGFDAVLVAVKHVFASLFKIAPSLIVCTRVTITVAWRSRRCSADGALRPRIFWRDVLHDTESGFDQVVFITSAWGLGEWSCRVRLTRMSFTCTNRHWRESPGYRAPHHGVEKNPHGLAPTQEHGKQVKIEDVPQEQRTSSRWPTKKCRNWQNRPYKWETLRSPNGYWVGERWPHRQLFIVQARPETVRSRGQVMERIRCIHRVRLSPKAVLSVIAWRGSGESHPWHQRNEPHRTWDVLVTDMTDPDWEPIMKKASPSSPIVAVVPVTRRSSLVNWHSGGSGLWWCNRTDERRWEVTVSCAEGDTGYVYAELLELAWKAPA